MLFQVSIRELHNKMMGPTEEGGLKEVQDKQNNIIIRDTLLIYTLTT